MRRSGKQARIAATSFVLVATSAGLLATDALAGGGDLVPDFKFMVVVTDPEHLRLKSMFD